MIWRLILPVKIEKAWKTILFPNPVQATSSDKQWYVSPLPKMRHLKAWTYSGRAVRGLPGVVWWSIRCRHASTRTVGCTATFSSSLVSSITDGRASRSIDGIALMRSLNAVCEATVGCVDCESSPFWSDARLLCYLFLPSLLRQIGPYRTWNLIDLGIYKNLEEFTEVHRR